MSLEEKTSSPIGEAIFKSLMSLDSLKEASQIFISSLEEEAKLARQSFRDEADQFSEEIIIQDVDGEDKKRVIFNIPVSHRRKIVDKHNRFKRLVHAKDIIPRNFLIAYVSEFDYFVGALLKNTYMLKPDLLNQSDRTFNFKDLSKFSSLEDVREEVIEKDIEQILRSSHTDQFKAIANKVDIETLTKFDNWSNFIEITERRNLFVHADGVISTQYQKICKTVNINIDNNQIGTKLDCSKEYLDQTYDIMYEVIVKLGQTIWRKVFGKSSKNKELADTYLIHLLFELLCNEQYKLAVNIGEFAIEQRSISNDFRKRMMVINLCLAYKYSNQIDKCNKLLNSYDWSSVQDVFQLALACIKDEHEDACRLIKSLINSNSDLVTESALHSWPLFKVLKEQQSFKKIYEELFQASFNNVSIIDESDLREEMSHADLEVTEIEVLAPQDMPEDDNLSAINNGENHANLEVTEIEVLAPQDMPEDDNLTAINNGENHANLENLEK
ncbi:hypothetical protein [Acinetobacter courvalinii]|uniref:hypothetical protein n=1 Tax=Acinetobacter courvalinii TaxID=280147 RepID=UPI0021D36DD7|nr:hypothetical protein [Acinetobacter courvalinii]MCU4640960.1 hypothetical protein [Acinetobacter courvalinii]